MRIQINIETCELSGKCVFFHPELFVEREDGYPEPRLAEIDEARRLDVLDAIEACPTGSISVVEEAPATGV
jgi:ferredoxin